MKPRLVFFSEYKIGGVQSFYANLLQHDPYGDMPKTWILERHASDQDPPPPQAFAVIPDERIVQLPDTDNIYEKGRVIARELTPEPGAFVTSFLEELVAIQYFTDKPKTVYFICHDEGYLPPAEQYGFLIDVFIAHNPFFYDELRSRLPGRTKDIFYLPYGIRPAPRNRTENLNGKLRVLFLARLHALKGVHELTEIDDYLISRGVSVEWTVVGDGPEREKLTASLKGRSNFTMKTLPSQDDVLAECSLHDVFVLPSYKDGLPVAMLESMSAGLVPVMYRFNPGIGKVLDDSQGFLVDVGDREALSMRILRLHEDRPLLERMSIACRDKVVRDYDVKVRAKAYYDLFRRYHEFRRRKKVKYIRHSGWLDLPIVPSRLRRMLRSLKTSGL